MENVLPFSHGAKWSDWCRISLCSRKTNTEDIFTIYYEYRHYVQQSHHACMLIGSFASALPLLYFKQTIEVLWMHCVVFKSQQGIYTDSLTTSTLIRWRESFRFRESRRLRMQLSTAKMPVIPLRLWGFWGQSRKRIYIRYSISWK